LQNDYAKFIRFGQWRIEQTGSGVLAFITDNSYLDGLIFRGMRQQLMQTFTDIYVLDLHGNSKRGEIAPDGGKDENVFDITQGVSIVFFIKVSDSDQDVATVYHYDLYGKRTDKYSWLNQHNISDSDWQIINPTSPYYFFVSRNVDFEREYIDLSRINDAMPINSASIVTGQDRTVISIDSDDIKNLAEAGSIEAKYIQPIRYRLFDTRYVLYHKDYVTRMRTDVMQHMVAGSELALICTRQQSQDTGWSLVGVSDMLTESCYISNKTREINYLIPLYVYPEKKTGQLFELDDDGSDFPLSEKGRRPNLSKAFVDEMVAKLGLKFETEGSAWATPPPSPLPASQGGGTAQPNWFGPEDVFYYAYAVFHSPTYRERYAEFLKIDFPRLPLTSDLGLFKVLVKLGAELVGLHLMTSPKLSNYITTFEVDGDNTIPARGGYPKYDEKHERVSINKTQYFGGVPDHIWTFHIGGYQVLHKWLKDRRGRELSYDDLTHYQQIVVALSETDRIMTAIDDAIPAFPIE